MPSPFVQASGTRFKLNDAPFPVSGVNCYFLAYCNDDSRRAAIATAKRMGAGVVRSWAFLEVDNYTPDALAFQYFKDGEIVVNDGPNGLYRLDALIKAAEDLEVKLILPLVNYWSNLGGMPAYVQWLSPGSDVTEFYRAPSLRAAYQNWVNQILTRRNTITGRLYSEEPAIMAWELTNEARCPIPGGRELLHEWVTEMSAFVKARDANHLLALGDEGYFNSGWTHVFDSFYNGSHGVDWARNLALPDIDFGTYHFYPQDWKRNDSDFATRWITDHHWAAAELNKPAIMEEFGLRIDGDSIRTPEDRNSKFSQWKDTIQNTGTAGRLLWMLGLQAADTSGYVDPYVIFDPAEVPALGTTGATATG
jgi:mannan endo-1,4-beta-mannosidase